MNKNSIIGFLLIAAIMIGYSIWMTPSKEELAKEKQKQDSIAQVAQKQQDSIKMAQAAVAKQNQTPAANQATTQPTNTTTQPQPTAQSNNPFSVSAQGKNEYYTIHTDLATYKISKKGGFINYVDLLKYKTYDGRPLILFDPKTSEFGISFFANNQLVNTKNLYFELVGNDSTTRDFKVSGKNKLTLHFRVYAHAPQQGQKSPYIQYTYTFTGDQYMLGFHLNMVNMQSIIPPTMNYLDIQWYADMMQQEKAVDQFNGSTIYYKPYNDNVDYLSENKDDHKEIKTKLKWTSFKLRFFSSTIIADHSFENGILTVHEIKEHKPSKHYLTSMSSDLTVPYNPMMANNSVGFRFYYGPNNFTLLKGYGMQLDHQIPIGWGFFLLAWINEGIVIPVFNWLGGLGWNYGIVILVLTILLKAILFPIAFTTYRSAAKMRVLKPEVDAINAKYPKKEDAVKKQQAVMALYKKAGANPASGCLPMLLQMPILFALFRFFPAAIQLRQQPFLWAHDLSSYDSILHLPFTIPWYGDHVSLFTLLMTASTILYTYMNNKMMGSAQTQTLPGMKTMMYLMPLIFLGWFNNYASGLSYYYFLANIITFLQMFLFQKFINEDKLRKKIEANKKRPAKKSNFQKRLEEAAKKKGYPAK